MISKPLSLMVLHAKSILSLVAISMPSPIKRRLALSFLRVPCRMILWMLVRSWVKVKNSLMPSISSLKRSLRNSTFSFWRGE